MGAVVQLGGFDQGIGGGGVSAAPLGAGEEPVLAAERNSPNTALGRVVADLEEVMVEIWPQSLDPGECVADRLRQG